MKNVNTNIKDFKYYVYEHYLDGELFYIGKGTKGRALDLEGRNHLWESKVNGRETDVEIKIIATFESNAHAELFEQNHIRMTSETNEQLTNIAYNDNSEPMYSQSPLNILNRMRSKKTFINNDYKCKEIKHISHVNQIENIIDDFNLSSEDKGLIYSETIQSMNNIKKVLINKGYNPLIMWSTNNAYNSMNKEQINANNELIKTGKIPDEYDFLIFNSHLFTRVNLKDESIKLLIINNGRQDIEQYIRGFVGRDIELLVTRISKDDYKIDMSSMEIPEEYLNVNLTAKDKVRLCVQLNIIDKKGRLYKWNKIKEIIIEIGYVVNDKTITIDKKRTRTSIIFPPNQ